VVSRIRDPLHIGNHGSFRTRRVYIAAPVEKHIGSFRAIQYHDWIAKCIDINDVALISLSAHRTIEVDWTNQKSLSIVRTSTTGGFLAAEHLRTKRSGDLEARVVSLLYDRSINGEQVQYMHNIRKQKWLIALNRPWGGDVIRKQALPVLKYANSEFEITEPMNHMTGICRTNAGVFRSPWSVVKSLI